MILHEVVTTEKVPFTYRVAGMGSRFLAALFDLVVLVVFGFAGLLAANVVEHAQAGLGQAVFVLWQFMLVWGYFLLFEWLWHGQTPGKRLLGIRVIQHNGTALGLTGATLRNLIRFVDLLPAPPFGVGFLTAANNRKNRRLGDFAGDSLVVHVERGAGPCRRFSTLKPTGRAWRCCGSA